MRQLSYLVPLALFCACQNVEDLPGYDNGAAGEAVAVSVDFTVPGGLQSRAATRAYGDGTSIKHIKWAVYKSNASSTGNSENLTPGDLVASDTYNFKTEDQGKMEGRFIIEKLTVGETYDFVFWAESDNSGYTFDTSTATISMNYGVGAEGSNWSGARCNDENRDAFFCSRRNVAITRGLNLTAVLVRPFAQLNILTDDLPENDASTYWVRIGGDGPFYNTLNLLNGRATTTGGSASPNFLPATASQEKMTINNKEYRVIAMNYILTDGLQSDTDTMYKDENDQYKKMYSVQLFKGTSANDKDHPMLGPSDNGITLVPFKRNYRTNIYGSLLSTSGSINYKIIPTFNGDMSSTLTATTQAELQQEITNATSGSVITLLADIELTSQLTFSDEKNITIDLNGNDIKGNADYNNTSLILLNNENATLTVEDTNPSGDGNLGLGIADYVIAVAKGNLVLKSGNYKGKKGCVKWLSSSTDNISRTTSPTIRIDGGFYSAVDLTDSNYRLLDFDCTVPPGGDNDWGKNNVRNFIVYGGQFQGFNPSAAVVNGYQTWNFLPSKQEYGQSVADNPATGNQEPNANNDQAEGYTVTLNETSGIYTVTYTAPAATSGTPSATSSGN